MTYHQLKQKKKVAIDVTYVTDANNISIICDPA